MHPCITESENHFHKIFYIKPIEKFLLFCGGVGEGWWVGKELNCIRRTILKRKSHHNKKRKEKLKTTRKERKKERKGKEKCSGDIILSFGIDRFEDSFQCTRKSGLSFTAHSNGH